MKVELVGYTQGVGKYSNLNHEEIVAAIARHGVIKEDNGKLVKYLMNNAHWSPLDMVNFVFEVETSRAIGRQMLRHSSIKIQEHSQRYSVSNTYEDIELRLEDKVNRQSSTDVVGRIKLRGFNETKDVVAVTALDGYQNIACEIEDCIRMIDSIYEKGIRLGIAKECMRNILPECTTSVITFNGTLRSWLSFLNVRLDKHAQKEIQEIAKLIGESLEKAMPNVFGTIDWRKGMFM